MQPNLLVAVFNGLRQMFCVDFDIFYNRLCSVDNEMQSVSSVPFLDEV